MPAKTDCPYPNDFRKPLRCKRNPFEMNRIHLALSLFGVGIGIGIDSSLGM